MNGCKKLDEKVFYILHSARNRLLNKEMKRAVYADTYAAVMSKEKLMTKSLHEKYPGAEFLLKDCTL